MSQLLVSRPARTPGPDVVTAPLALLEPPQLPPDGSSGSWVTYLFPVLGSAGSLVFVLVNPSPVYLIGGILFALGSVGMGVGLYVSQRSLRRGGLGESRARYLAYVDRVRDELRVDAQQQRAAASWAHPDPAALPGVVADGRRLWERRAVDADFLSVRLGRGPQPLRRPLLEPSQDGLAVAEPVSAAALRRLVQGWSTVEDQPLASALRHVAVVSVLDESGRGAARALLRAVLAEATAFHSPDDLRVAVCAGPDARAAWGWVKWLPHAQHPEAEDGTGPMRLVADTRPELDALLGAELEQRRRWRRGAPTTAVALPAHRDGDAGPGQAAAATLLPPGPHLLVVVDAPAGAPGSASALDDTAGLAVTVLHVLDRQADEPGRVDLRWRLGAAGMHVEPDGRRPEGSPPVTPDSLSLAEAEAWARRLAPVRLSASAPDRALVQTLELPDLLGIDDVAALDPASTWAPRPLREQLVAPLGVDPAGQPVHLDLKESALDGMGPHGLVVGATGSGKSELLRTLVTGLAITHPPDLLSFVLVDFKGGATFAGMAGLPHVAGIVTNLADDQAMVDRFHAALFGEMNRRQELLRRAGNLSSAREYRTRRDAGAPLEPLPYLLVIVDEFSELLAQRPDFIDLFVALGRLGRSLGMHLLFASQRLDEGRLRGLESHLSYRIGLRTFSAAESRVVLGVPDAHELPPVPGSAYLKVDASSLQRLRVAMVSGPYRETTAALPQAPAVQPFAARSPLREDAPPPAFEPDPHDVGRRSVMDVAVERLAAAAPRTHQVWLPPLPPALDLVALLGPAVWDPLRGRQCSSWPTGGLRVPVGLVDRPAEQRREPLVVDLAGPAGHLAVVGGPQSGKSTFLRTLLAALVLTHTPDEVQVHALDFGGGLLTALADAPHVGTIATRLDPERVRRVVSEVHAVLQHRESSFTAAGIDGVVALRARRAAGLLPGGDSADLVLLVDDWTAVRREFEDLEPLLQDVAARGLGYGVHLVVTASRWLDIRTPVRDHIQGRLELRLGETADSAIDRRQAAQVATGTPGRGLTPEGLQMQVALPRPDAAGPGGPADGDVAGVLAATARASRECWPGRPARPVRILPLQLEFADLPAAGGDTGRGLPLGIGESDLAAAYLDVDGAEPHLLVLGDGESGKTAVLRSLLASLVLRRPAEQVKVVVVDYRRGLLGAVPDPYLLEFGGSDTAATAHVAELCTVLRKRLPGPETTPAQLRARSWWSGADVYLVVDDYDLVPTTTGNPLAPLTDLLPHARDIGLHLLLARRVAGISRAMFDPVLTRLQELGTTGLLLSGDPSEGAVLAGVRAVALPPGRGLLVHRRQRPLLVQTAWLPPVD